ncbi:MULTISPECIES: hypothetical protein [unclassified Streptomyces]|uniref:hypothetical protein n=1 Tax=unclassified Streptomyces TaxID=2593676 RepID=UPI001650332A|nr:hypothetical protein [Streptomyces sp. gb1(2016)]
MRVFFGDGLATVADGDTHLRNRRLMQPMFNKAHIAHPPPGPKASHAMCTPT